MRMFVQGCNKLKMPRILGDKERVDVAAPGLMNRRCSGLIDHRRLRVINSRIFIDTANSSPSHLFLAGGRWLRLRDSRERW